MPFSFSFLIGTENVMCSSELFLKFSKCPSNSSVESLMMKWQSQLQQSLNMTRISFGILYPRLQTRCAVSLTFLCYAVRTDLTTIFIPMKVLIELLTSSCMIFSCYLSAIAFLVLLNLLVFVFYFRFVLHRVSTSVEIILVFVAFKWTTFK